MLSIGRFIISEPMEVKMVKATGPCCAQLPPSVAPSTGPDGGNLSKKERKAGPTCASNALQKD